MNGYSDWDERSYSNISLSRFRRTLNVDRLFDVIVYRLGNPIPSRNLAKFTELQHGLNVCPTTSLITLNYCRKLEGSGKSMVDNNEGVLSSPSNNQTLRETIRSYLLGRKIPLELRRKVKLLQEGGRLTANPGWIWCLCRVPNRPSSTEWKVIRDYFCKNHKYRMTLLRTSDINDVCFEIGKVIGECSVRMKNWSEWYGKLPLIGLNRKIIVIHGPIMYTDHRDEFVGNYAGMAVRAILSCFTKETRFRFEQEYRVLVLGFEPPKKDQVILRLTPKMSRILNITGNNVDCLPTTVTPGYTK